MIEEKRVRGRMYELGMSPARTDRAWLDCMVMKVEIQHNLDLENIALNSSSSRGLYDYLNEVLRANFLKCASKCFKLNSNIN